LEHEYGAEPRDDPSVQRLVANVDPAMRANPQPQPCYDLVVLGAGVAGLISCIVGRQMGRKIAMVEQHYMGGDCLNTGCVPSKALIAAAQAAHRVRDASRFGVTLRPEDVTVDFEAVMSRMRQIRAEISEHDSVHRYTVDVGVDVFSGRARFTDSNALVLSGGEKLRFRKCILGTGATAKVPEQLQGIPHLTSSNLWNLGSCPPRLIVLGAGTIGVEIAQAMQRLGSQVTLVIGPSGRLMRKEEPEAAQAVRDSLARDGVSFCSPTTLVAIRRSSTAAEVDSADMYKAPFATYQLEYEDGDGGVYHIEAEALLNATGRVARTTGLDLSAAGVRGGNDGLEVNALLQTSNPDVFAAGDCLPDGSRFTHAAEWQARVAVRNAMLGEEIDARRLLVPRATYTDPEVASVGRSAAQLRSAGVEFQTFVRQAADVDRFRCEGVSDGFASLHVGHDGKILGATIVGPNAGDHISEVTLCMQHDITADELAGTIHPYPTAAEVVRQAAQAYVRSRIFQPSNQELLRRMSEPCEFIRSELSESGLRTILLQRPKALNACDALMAKAIGEAASADSKCLLLQSSDAGAPGKAAFCAGGDVKAMATMLKEEPNSSLPKLQIGHEYRAVATLSRKRQEGVPVIAFMDGITMGFGLGLACAAKFRVVTERSLLAMPECAIGISPDVGFSATQHRLAYGSLKQAMAAALPVPGLGRCMALTGWRLTGPEALAAGLATHLVPWKGLGALKEKLRCLNWEEEASKVQLAQILREETLSLDSVDSGLNDTILQVLSQTFTPSTSAKEIRDRMRALSADSEVDADVKSWLEQRLSGFEKGCPMTQEVVQCLMDQADQELQLLEAPEESDRHELLCSALERDYATLMRLLRAGDFYEGVRAALIDKDSAPQWMADLDSLDPSEVRGAIAPLPDSQRIDLS